MCFGQQISCALFPFRYSFHADPSILRSIDGGRLAYLNEVAARLLSLCLIDLYYCEMPTHKGPYEDFFKDREIVPVMKSEAKSLIGKQISWREG